MKTVYSYDTVSGALQGLVELNDGDRSPLEPEVWLLPAGTTAVVPPTPVPGWITTWTGTEWTLRADPRPPLPDPDNTTPSTEPPSLDDLAEAYRDAVQAHMDARARSLGYDDIRNAVTYAEEPSVPRFQEEGRAFRAWRSLVWEHCYALFDRVKAGQALIPTHEALFAGLPVLILPVRQTA